MKKKTRWERNPVVPAVIVATLALGYLICQASIGKMQSGWETETMEMPRGNNLERDALEGDSGLSDEELQSPVAKDKTVQTRKELVRMALEGVGNIPFLEGGNLTNGQFPQLWMDNRFLEKEFRTGLDSLGYVQWLYSQLFQEPITDPAEEFRQGKRIVLEELRTGDVVMREYQEGTANHYGVFLGYDREIPVVVHCDSGPWPRFPEGVLKLSAIGGEGEYYMGTPAEDFSYFSRPAVVWDEENDFSDDITDIMQKYHTKETDLLNQCGNYGTILFREIQQKNYQGALEKINLEVVKKRGYSLDEKRFIKKLESLSQNGAQKRIMIYNVSELPDSGAVVARFCLIGVRKGIDDEMIYDTLHCQWLDFTFYLNSAGEITSYLPCHEAMLAAEYGLVKK